MRHSLKWILAGTAYAALAAAGLSRGTWVYADLLWAASLVGFGCAVVLACFTRGAPQVAAAGFVVFAACFLVCLEFAPASVPTRRLLFAAGIGAGPSVTVQNPPSAPSPADPFADDPFGAAAAVPSSAATDDPFADDPFALPAVAPVLQGRLRNPPARTSQVDLTNVIRAGNAIGMMALGVLGFVFGSLIFRASKGTGPIGAPAPPPVAANPIRRLG